MFDIAPSEFLLVAFVALVVIGPKDLPKAMRVVGYWVGKARGVARQFRSGFDSMVREAELEEMEKRWAAENERIMREHPQSGPGAETTQAVHSPETEEHRRDYRSIDAVDDHTNEPVMVEKPVVAAAPPHASPAAADPPFEDPGVDPIAPPAAVPVVPAIGYPDDKTGKSDVASS
jgi:sec-independent protein translocase protein TatB